MRRKSFFERICGNKPSNANTETPVRVTSLKADRFDIVSDEPKESLKAESEGGKRMTVNAFNDGVYGSTSTVDSSCLSIERKIDENAKHTNKGFVDLKIKKVKLTKNINSRLEFVPLTGHLINNKTDDNETKTLQERFKNSNFASDFTDLVDEFEKFDGECVQLDADVLKQVFSKGKY